VKYSKFFSIVLVFLVAPLFLHAQEPSDSLDIDSLGRAEPDTSFFFMSDRPVDTVVSYNFSDSLKSRFLLQKDELSDNLERSFNHDPSDYLKFFPSYMILNYQATPMRRAVYPMGLPGGRQNVVLDSRQLNPLEHIVVPDGKTDIEDYPVAQVEKSWNIEGPLGMAFGGENAVGTLYLEPYGNIDGKAKSKLYVGTGGYGFADTRGMFANENESGFALKAGAQYRKYDGLRSNSDDNAYHQFAEVVYPLSARSRIQFSGRLYKRDGRFPFMPDYGYTDLNQFRRDRDFAFAFQRDYKNGGRSTVEFRHQRSESSLKQVLTTFDYERALDIFDNGLHLRYENKFGRFDAATGMHLDLYEYHDNGWEYKRKGGKWYGNILSGDSAFAWTAYASLEKRGGFNPGPSMMLSFIDNSGEFTWQASAGYRTKFPRQYELDLRPLLGDITTIDGIDYYESGNSLLKAEKQLAANLSASYGPLENNWHLSLTGGKVFDGIDWVQYPLDTLGVIVDAFGPVNHDLEFVNATLTKKLYLWNKVWMYGGASYRYVKVDGDDSPYYSPDYQAFGGLELYHYLEFIETHLYGYLEGVFVGKYDTPAGFGTPGTTRGNEGIVNLRLSFRIKQFRFYFVSQNLLTTFYTMRDGYSIGERFAFYGITWSFTD